jgi:hypothetical protein
VTDPNKPDQKPAGPSPAQESKPAPQAYISPRLRQKLQEAEETEDDWTPKAASPLPAIITAIVVIAVAVGGIMWWRSVAKKDAAVKAAAAAAAARADSLASLARAESLAVAAHAESLAVAARADSLARARARARAGGAGGEAENGTPTSGFGIAVGRYMDEERADSERDRLSAATGLAGMVAPTKEGGTTMYRVILGKFTSHESAERKATALADSSLVRQAIVVARPK